MGTLVGSGRVDPYVLDVASMHASALAFLNEYDVSTFHWRLRRSASRPHARVRGPQRTTTTRPADMVAPLSRSHAHRVPRRDVTTGHGIGARKAFLRVSAHVYFMYMLQGHNLHDTVTRQGAART